MIESALSLCCLNHLKIIGAFLLLCIVVYCKFRIQFQKRHYIKFMNALLQYAALHYKLDGSYYDAL